MREHIDEDTSRNPCTKHNCANTDRKCTSHTVATYIVLFDAVYVCVALVFLFVITRTGSIKQHWRNVWIVLGLVTFFLCCHLAVFLAPIDSCGCSLLLSIVLFVLCVRIDDWCGQMKVSNVVMVCCGRSSSKNKFMCVFVCVLLAHLLFSD